MASSEFEYHEGFKYQRKVRVIIASERGEFLLIQPHGYEADAWTLVGGGVEPGESEEQAIVREIREEIGITELTGLEASSIRHRFVFSDSAKRCELNHDGQAATVFFATTTPGASVVIQEEIQAYRWSSLGAAELLLKVAPQKGLFNEVISEFKKHPVVKRALSARA